MDNIKPIPGFHPFQINTANEAKDEERRRELPKKDRDKKKPTEKKVSVGESAALNSSPNDDKSSVNRQIIDSEKLVELLEFKPREAAATKKYQMKSGAPKKAESHIFSSTKR